MSKKKNKKMQKEFEDLFDFSPSQETTLIGEIHNISLNLSALVTELKYLNDSVKYFNNIFNEGFKQQYGEGFKESSDEEDEEEEEEEEEEEKEKEDSNISEMIIPDQPVIHKKWIDEEIFRLNSGWTTDEMAKSLGIKKKSYQKRINVMKKTGEINIVYRATGNN